MNPTLANSTFGSFGSGVKDAGSQIHEIGSEGISLRLQKAWFQWFSTLNLSDIRHKCGCD